MDTCFIPPQTRLPGSWKSGDPGPGLTTRSKTGGKTLLRSAPNYTRNKKLALQQALTPIYGGKIPQNRYIWVIHQGLEP